MTAAAKFRGAHATRVWKPATRRLIVQNFQS